MLDEEGGEDLRNVGRSGRDVQEFVKSAILEILTVDNSNEHCAPHDGNMIQSSDVESIANQAVNSICSDNRSVPCGVNMVCDTKIASHSTSTEGSSRETSKEEMGCATVQSMLVTPPFVNNTHIAELLEDDIEEVISKALILTQDCCSNSSLANSELQNKEQNMEFSVSADHADAVNEQILDLHEALILTPDCCSNSSLANSELQNKEQNMEV